MTTTITIRRYRSDFANLADGLRIVPEDVGDEEGLYEDRRYALPIGLEIGEDEGGAVRLYRGADYGELSSPKHTDCMRVCFGDTSIALKAV